MARRAPGEGTIIKTTDGRWKAILSVGSVGGKRKRRTKTAKTKADAAALLRTMRAEAGAAPALTAKRISTADLLAKYLDLEVENHCAPATLAVYSSTINVHLAPRLGTVQAIDLSPILITEMLTTLVKDKVGSRTQQNAFDVLNRALKWAARLGYIPFHPMVGLSRPKHEGKEMFPFAFDESQRLLQETAGELIHGLLQLAITTGMRQGELFGLEWNRVDFESCSLRVEQAVAEVNGRLEIRKPKTKRGIRTINLTPVTIRALQDHRAMLLQRGLAGSALVFPAREGGPQSRVNWNHREWRPLLKRTELRYRGAHNLRHTYATLALGVGGIPLHVVSAIMGHSKPSITHDLYSHVLPADQQHATNAMTRLFG